MKVAAEKMTSTTVIHIHQSQIDAINATVNAWEDVPAAPGIHQMHVVQNCLDDYTVKLWKTGSDCRFEVPEIVQYPRPAYEPQMDTHQEVWKPCDVLATGSTLKEAGVLFSMTDYSILVK